MTDAQWRVLLDTNIWISAFINPTGPPARVLNLFLDGRYQPVASLSLLNEITDVLSRRRVRRAIRASDERIETWLSRLQSDALFVNPEGILCLCRDPEDDVILETAILARAHYVVSRDDDIKRDLDLIAHLHEHNIEVVTVAQFLRVLGED